MNSAGSKFRTSLLQAAQSRIVSSQGSAANGIDRNVNLVTQSQKILGRESQTRFRPQGGEDELLAARRGHGVLELDVLPAIDRCTVNSGDTREHGSDLRNRGLVESGFDVHCGMHDGQLVEQRRA
ncbi:unnamed protein product [Periconia digitata]|uniref:Uncharacterized protein n=1 Tax=Periconia digitata TaxID=1303443 RepID=A0A9W4UJX6_9PLEO|nr:unnamed protein product [Periconia digitata]